MKPFTFWKWKHISKKNHILEMKFVYNCVMCLEKFLSKRCALTYSITQGFTYITLNRLQSLVMHMCVQQVFKNVQCKWGQRSKKTQSKFWICYWFNLSTILSLFLGGNEAVNNTMHQQLPASSYAGLPHAPTIQQVNNLGPVNPEPQSPINPALMAQPNQQQMQVIRSSNAIEVVQY